MNDSASLRQKLSALFTKTAYLLHTIHEQAHMTPLPKHHMHAVEEERLRLVNLHCHAASHRGLISEVQLMHAQKGDLLLCGLQY